jgi:hypothetical protein
MIAEAGGFGVNAGFARLMSDEWWNLTRREQAEAITYAKLAGPMVALAWFGKDGDGTPPPSFSSLIPPDTDQFEDGSLIPGARTHGLPNPPFYIRFVVGTACPEKLEAWRRAWREEPEDVVRDPRVYYFCAGFERERCRLLKKKEPPADPATLAKLSVEYQDEERQVARELFDGLAGSKDLEALDVEEIGTEYQIARARTDRAFMLLAAATGAFDHSA